MIFNRRLERCEICGADMPAELRFSAEEIVELDRQMAQLAERRRKRDREQEEERKKEIQNRPSRGLGPRDFSDAIAKSSAEDAT
jgi:hypothetical protein